MQHKLAIHDAQRVYFREGTDPELRARHHVNDAMHPVFQSQPDSGRRALYVSPGARKISGVPDSESRELLKELLAHAYRPEFIYEHRWQFGDLAVWDNVGLQHSRPAIPPGTRRTLRGFEGGSER